MHNTVYVLILVSLCMSCTPMPKPIDYGSDQCYGCKMIIADKRFGAELVTTKGKVYKFDAIECLIPEVKENGEDHYKHILVSDYSRPGEFLDATTGFFLISEQVPSPMGYSLSSYATQEALSNVMREHGGESYDWKQLYSQFK